MVNLSIYAVTYDLHSPGQDYDKLHEQLKSYSSYSKRFDSFWLIDSTKSASEIRDELIKVVDKNDKLFVIEVKKHWAGRKLADGMVNWLKHDDRTF